jgi:DNA-directed RNA polymerase specialized sigma subunit
MLGMGEYLKRGWTINPEINSKLQHLAELRSQVTRVTTSISDMPHNPNGTQLQEIILKIIALEEKINADVDRLVDMKAEIYNAIQSLDDAECRTILEKRYLSMLDWAQIAAEMGCSTEKAYKKHRQALEALENIFDPYS